MQPLATNLLRAANTSFFLCFLLQKQRLTPLIKNACNVSKLINIGCYVSMIILLNIYSLWSRALAVKCTLIQQRLRKSHFLPSTHNTHYRFVSYNTPILFIKMGKNKGFDGGMWLKCWQRADSHCDNTRASHCRAVNSTLVSCILGLYVRPLGFQAYWLAYGEPGLPCFVCCNFKPLAVDLALTIRNVASIKQHDAYKFLILMSEHAK